MFLLALAGNLWLAGWWLVAVLATAAVLLPLGPASAALVGAYLLVLGLDPDAVALSPLGPSQAGRFYGFSNLLATTFLVPALLGAPCSGRAACSWAPPRSSPSAAPASGPTGRAARPPRLCGPGVRLSAAVG